MGLGEGIEAVIKRLRTWRELRQPGPLGDFYRYGGSALLFNDLPVKTDELVIDGGGYQGAWTDEMLCRYGCRSIIFEPVPVFANALRTRYANNTRVEVIETAMANAGRREKIRLNDDGSSVYPAGTGANEIDITLIDFGAFLNEHAYDKLGCLKLNIEGGEYDVLEQLISLEKLKSISCLLVQFHSVVPQSEERRQRIQHALKKTHDCRFEFPFIWECWVRRSA